MSWPSLHSKNISSLGILAAIIHSLSEDYDKLKIIWLISTLLLRYDCAFIWTWRLTFFHLKGFFQCVRLVLVLRGSFIEVDRVKVSNQWTFMQILSLFKEAVEISRLIKIDYLSNLLQFYLNQLLHVLLLSWL